MMHVKCTPIHMTKAIYRAKTYINREEGKTEYL